MTGAGPTVGDIGEMALLRRLWPYLDHPGRGLEVGAGDDAAVWQPGQGRAVAVTTDSLVEDVHFHSRSGDTGFYADLGWKLLAISLSDVAAMGAEPGPTFLALSLPGSWLVADVEALYQGLADCAREHGASLAGGNLSAATTAVLTSTCLGAVAPGRALRRDGAKPGWKLACTGSLGGAVAALRLALDPGAADGRLPAEPITTAWRRRLRRPQPRLAAARLLMEEGIGTCIDVSDGLYSDLARMLRDGLGAVVELDLVPVEAGLRDAFPNAWIEIVGGGEDYELLFAGPPAEIERACRRVTAGGIDASVIGAFDEGVGVRLRAASGAESQAPPTGHEHFAG